MMVTKSQAERIIVSLYDKGSVVVGTYKKEKGAHAIAKNFRQAVANHQVNNLYINVQVIPSKDEFAIVLSLGKSLPCGGIPNEYCHKCGIVHFAFDSSMSNAERARAKQRIYGDWMNVLKIRAQLRRDSHLLKDEIVDPDMKGPMVGAMRAAFGGDEERTIALAWLFDYNDDPPLLPKSSKDLTEGQWAALKKWIDADPDNKFEPSEDFKTQAVLVAKMSVNVFKIDTENLDVVDPGGMLETALLLGGKENKNGEEQSD